MARHPRSRIGRAPTPTQMIGIPIASTMIASMTPALPVISSVPLMPSWGFLMLLAWRMLHRNLFPIWIAVPLGFFDDLLSGNALGSSMMLWAVAFLILEILDRRMVWRDFRQEWAIASTFIVGVIAAQLAISHMLGATTPFIVMVPQMIVSILVFPLVARACLILDVWRLS
jgi:rod shape-determining protein MreD